MKAQKELDLQPSAPAKRTLEAIDSIFGLLRPATSLAVVSDFLKSKNLRFSATSWEEMKEKRILPAIRQQKISLADLKQLLSEAEEFGRVIQWSRHPKCHQMCGLNSRGTLSLFLIVGVVTGSRTGRSQMRAVTGVIGRTGSMLTL